MKKQTPKKATPAEPSVNDALILSKKAFSAAYKNRNGMKNNGYALLARESFDALILTRKIEPKHVEFLLEKKIDFFLERAIVTEKKNKDIKLNKSIDKISQRLGHLESSNKKLKIQNDRLEQQNKEQIKIALNAQAEVKSVLSSLETSQKATKKAELKATVLALSLFTVSTFLAVYSMQGSLSVGSSPVSKKPATAARLKDMICHRQKFNISNSSYIMNPIASSNGKTPKPVLTQKCLNTSPTTSTPKAQL